MCACWGGACTGVAGGVNSTGLPLQSTQKQLKEAEVCTMEKHLWWIGVPVKAATAGLPLQGNEAEPSMARGASLEKAVCFGWQWRRVAGTNAGQLLLYAKA